MIKRKINLMIVCICLLGLLIISLFFLYPKSDSSIKINRKTNTNIITFLRETGIDTNTYEEVTDNNWLNEDFEYNKEKSGCTNGSNISFNSETKQVMIEATQADTCYIYFDKIN